MNITRARVIVGDVFILIVLAAMYSATKGFTENILAICLVLVIDSPEYLLSRKLV